MCLTGTILRFRLIGLVGTARLVAVAARLPSSRAAVAEPDLLMCWPAASLTSVPDPFFGLSTWAFFEMYCLQWGQNWRVIEDFWPQCGHSRITSELSPAISMSWESISSALS
ncbi:hypothetical protein D3C72_512990 [compost metagenome]